MKKAIFAGCIILSATVASCMETETLGSRFDKASYNLSYHLSHKEKDADIAYAEFEKKSADLDAYLTSIEQQWKMPFATSITLEELNSGKFITSNVSELLRVEPTGTTLSRYLKDVRGLENAGYECVCVVRTVIEAGPWSGSKACVSYAIKGDTLIILRTGGVGWEEYLSPPEYRASLDMLCCGLEIKTVIGCMYENTVYEIQKDREDRLETTLRSIKGLERINLVRDNDKTYFKMVKTY